MKTLIAVLLLVFSANAYAVTVGEFVLYAGSRHPEYRTHLESVYAGLVTYNNTLKPKDRKFCIPENTFIVPYNLVLETINGFIRDNSWALNSVSSQSSIESVLLFRLHLRYPCN